MEFEPYKLQKEEDGSFSVSKLDADVYEITGGLVDELSRKVDLDDYDSFRYFQRVIKERGVESALKKAGAKDGDTVIIGEIEFEFLE